MPTIIRIFTRHLHGVLSRWSCAVTLRLRTAGHPPVANGAPGSEAKNSEEDHPTLAQKKQRRYVLSKVQQPFHQPLPSLEGKLRRVRFIVVREAGIIELWMDHEGYRSSRNGSALLRVAAFVAEIG